MIVIEEENDLQIPAVREKFFGRLYEEIFPIVATFVSHRNGTLQDAKDVFHDALIILYEKMVSNKLPNGVSADLYLVGIAKHVWIRKFNRNKLSVSLSDTEAAITLPADFFTDTNDRKILSLIETTGKRCLDMLKSLYYDKLSLADVAKNLGYGSTHSASVQKFKCLEKMRDTVKQKSIDYADFFE